jgi:hypothetical protein
LRIPIGHCVASWDNLTNKGLIKALPDRVFVWNEAQKVEAQALHGVPEERVIVTGAQIFDHWFEMKPTRNRSEFCATTGLDPSKPIILLIRPHPKAKKTLSQWDHPDLKKFENVVVFPRGHELSLARHGQDDYFNSLYHAEAVVGINTSAMLEASIVGRRSFTILLGEVREGQDGMVHFQHLSQHRFLGVAHNLEEHIQQLREEFESNDDQTSLFVGSFLRPCGIDQPATPVFVAEVEEMKDLVVEGPSLCARLGWIQRPLLLPLVAVVSFASALPWLLRFLRLAHKRLHKAVSNVRRAPRHLWASVRNGWAACCGAPDRFRTGPP